MKKITNLELGSLTYFLMKALFSFISFNSIIHIAKQDSYISIIIGILLGIIPLFAFNLLFNYAPHLNIFDKNKKLFGSILGGITNFIIICLIFFICLCLFIDLITFVQEEYLNKTPVILISILFMIGIIYTIFHGVNSTIRSSTIFFFISLILFIISISGLLFKIDLNNFKPVLHHNYYKGSFSYIAYSVLPLYLLLLIPKEKIVNSNNTLKTMLIYYFFSSFTLILIVLSIIGIFGINLTMLYNYPEFQILKYVYLQGISSKLNSVLFIQSILDMMIFIIFGLQFCLIGIHTYVKKKKNIISFIFSIIIILICEKISNTTFLKIITKHLLVNIIFYTITFILILSIIILLFKDKVISKSSRTN